MGSFNVVDILNVIIPSIILKYYFSKRVEFSKMNRVVLSSGTRQLLNKPVQTLARPVLVTQTRTYISLLPNWEDNTPVAPHQWGTKFVVSIRCNC